MKDEKKSIEFMHDTIEAFGAEGVSIMTAIAIALCKKAKNPKQCFQELRNLVNDERVNELFE